MDSIRFDNSSHSNYEENIFNQDRKIQWYDQENLKKMEAINQLVEIRQPQ